MAHKQRYTRDIYITNIYLLNTSTDATFLMFISNVCYYNCAKKNEIICLHTLAVTYTGNENLKKHVSAILLSKYLVII